MPKTKTKFEQLKRQIIFVIKKAEHDLIRNIMSEWMGGRLSAYQQVLELINRLES